jgi:hypothetical protein
VENKMRCNRNKNKTSPTKKKRRPLLTPVTVS